MTGRVFEERDGADVIERRGVNQDRRRCGAKGKRPLPVPASRRGSLDFKGLHSYHEESDHEDAGEQFVRDYFEGNDISPTNPVAWDHRLARACSRARALSSPPADRPSRRAGGTPGGKIKARGVPKVMTMTSTYYDGVIQGESGSSCAGSRSCCRARTNSTRPSRGTRCHRRRSPSAHVARLGTAGRCPLPLVGRCPQRRREAETPPSSQRRSPRGCQGTGPTVTSRRGSTPPRSEPRGDPLISLSTST